MRRDWPNSTGCVSSTQISLTVPARGATMGFIVFIASTMSSVSPSLTVSPTFTNGAAPGCGDTYTIPTIGDVTAPGAGPSRFGGEDSATSAAGACAGAAAIGTC